MANTTKTTNQTAGLSTSLAAEVNRGQQKRRALARQYAAEEQVTVQGSPFYKPYFGSNMPIQINGIAVYVPLDGKPYKIPKTFADVFNTRLSRVDSLIQKQGQMSAIVEESYAGEVNLLSEA